VTNLLVTGDLHLTVHPRDEYRWAVWEWLNDQAAKRGVDAVIVLGDITDKKDNHSARLVNRLHDTIARFPVPVWMIRGNHDYDVDPSCPFFRFLPTFITEPRMVTIGDLRCFFLPHIRVTHGYQWPDVPKCEFLFMHQTFTGSIAENGSRLEGLNPDDFSGAAKIATVSGDIHVPQEVRGIVYAGAPHPIRFGDDFQPRVLYYDGERLRGIKRTTIRKSVAVLRADDPLRYLMDVASKGDQLKVKYVLPRREFHSWAERMEAVRKWCDDRGVDLHGFVLEEEKPSRQRERSDESARPPLGADVRSHVDLFEEFCRERSIDPEYRDLGRTFVDGRT
jgi:predicted phosphodiesterase